MDGAATRARKVIFARVFLHEFDELFSIACTHALWINYQNLWNVGNHCNWNKTFLNVVI